MQKKAISLILFLSVVLCSFHLLPSEKTTADILDDIEKIDLKFNDITFADIVDVGLLPDGFVMVANESSYGDMYMLLKVTRNGNLVTVYNKRGNGPGELRNIENLYVTMDSIFVAERISPYLHEFSHNLEFKTDHRLKHPGKVFKAGRYLGIWSTNTVGEKKIEHIYILALYDKDTYEFKKYAFEIDEIPAFVQRWGELCQVDEKTFTGIYPTQYQIKIFDEDMQFKKDLIKKSPAHIKPYIPWKKSPYNLDNEGFKWMHSWSKLQSLYFIEGKFILKHLLEKERYLDIIDREGNITDYGFKEEKNSNYIFSEGDYLWKLTWNEDNTKYQLIKSKLKPKIH